MSQCELMPMPAPSVVLHDGHPATTSLEVAKFFDKPHKNVVRDVRNLIANCPKKFSGLNFELADYVDEQSKNRPMFIIFKDGFTLLVMGYTGPEAMRFKLAYIEAFNALEAELQRQREGALPPAPRKFSPSSTVSRKPLERLVKGWASQSAHALDGDGKGPLRAQGRAGGRMAGLCRRNKAEVRQAGAGVPPGRRVFVQFALEPNTDGTHRAHGCGNGHSQLHRLRCPDSP